MASTTSGRVKWFNNKAGYGFISITDSATNEERDMFVHHSEIKVEQTQYKYLVQGEYVEFVIAPVNREGSSDLHATNVCGIKGGKLMCETRNEVRTYRATTQPVKSRQAAPPTQAPQTQAAPTQAPQTQAAPPAQQVPSTPRPERRPKLAQSDQTEWMVVPRRRTETTTSRPKNQPRQRKPEIEIAQ